MNEKTKLPEGLELAIDLIESTLAGPNARASARAAIRAEHGQRLTLQHHAADLAQRVADLEAERDKLRAQLAELEQQEPVAWIEHDHSGTGQKRLHFVRRRECLRDEVINPVWTPIYARPVHTIPDGWRLVPVDPTPEMIAAGQDVKRRRLLAAVAAAKRSERHDPMAQAMAVNEEWSAMIAVALEHKA